MKIAVPYAVQDGDLTTNATESVAAWSSVTAYTVGQTVSYARRVWESIQNGTNKQPDLNPLHWKDMRPTNPWAMFDDKTGTQTVRADNLTVTVDVSGYADTVGLLNISASSLNVTVRGPTPERTNKVVWSSDFTNVAWYKEGATVTPNTADGPGGPLTMSKLVQAAGTNHNIAHFLTTAGGGQTLSIFGKAAEQSHLDFYFTDGDVRYVRFDLAAGTVSVLDGPVIAAEIEPWPDGVYRCWIAADTVAGSSAFAFALTEVPGDGDGTSGLYVWGVQLEDGSAPTEYIPTTSAPASSSTEIVFNEDIMLVDDTAVTDYYEYFFEPIIRLTDVVIPITPDIPSPSITIKLDDEGEDVKAGHMVVGKARYIGEVVYGATIGITDFSRIEEDDFGNTFIAERGYNRRGRFNVWLRKADVDAVYNIVSSLRATPVLIIATEQYSSTLYFGLLREAEIEIAYPTHSIMSVEVRGL